MIISSTQSEISEALAGLGAKIQGTKVNCPFHDDTHASGSIYQGEDGKHRFKCFVCNWTGDVVDIKAKAAGITPQEWLRQNKTATDKPKEKTYPTIEALIESIPDNENIYYYNNPYNNAVDMLVVRRRTPEGKAFIPCHNRGDGYVMRAPTKPWPLYNRSALVDADTVVIFEGEKCVDAVKQFEIAATTSAGGSNNAKSSNWSPLAGKNCVLWPDCDEAGRKYTDDVESILQKLDPPARITRIDPTNIEMQSGEDVYDFIEQCRAIKNDNGYIKDELLKVLNIARPRGQSVGLAERIEDAIDGRIYTMPWPWLKVTRLTKALQPGTVTLLCGGPGASKSLAVLQCMMFWHDNNIKAAIWCLEEDRPYHLTRILAQRARIADLTDPDWIKDNAETSRAIYNEHQEFLDAVAPRIKAESTLQPYPEQICEWVKQQAVNGCKIICVDPITAARQQRDSWVADSMFLSLIKTIATDNRVAVLLVTHPIKLAAKKPGLDMLAGAAAYSRFCQCILWLDSHRSITSKISYSMGESMAEHNRTMHLLKTRNTSGMGIHIAMNLNVKSLTLDEVGIITEDK